MPGHVDWEHLPAVDVGRVCEAGDLVHLLPEAQGELAGHGAGEGQAEVLPGGDVHLGVGDDSLGGTAVC